MVIAAGSAQLALMAVFEVSVYFPPTCLQVLFTVTSPNYHLQAENGLWTALHRISGLMRMDI